MPACLKYLTVRSGGVYNFARIHTHSEMVVTVLTAYVLTLCVSSQNYSGMKIDTTQIKTNVKLQLTSSGTQRFTQNTHTRAQTSV